MANNKNSASDELIMSFFKLHRALRQMITTPDFVTDLTVLQLQAIHYIHEMTNPTMSQLAQEFQVTLPTTTKMVERLVDLHLVLREPDEKDRRMVRIKLTPHGEQTLHQLRTQKLEEMKNIFQLLPEKDIQELLRINNDLLARIASR